MTERQPPTAKGKTDSMRNARSKPYGITEVSGEAHAP
jgi:hypothetical protein